MNKLEKKKQSNNIVLHNVKVVCNFGGYKSTIRLI